MTYSTRAIRKRHSQQESFRRVLWRFRACLPLGGANVSSGKLKREIKKGRQPTRPASLSLSARFYCSCSAVCSLLLGDESLWCTRPGGSEGSVDDAGVINGAGFGIGAVRIIESGEVSTG